MSERCLPFETDLSALLDGELGAEQAKAVQAHADACASCGATLRALRGVSSVLHRWEAQEVRYVASNAFRNRVLSRVGGSEAASRPLPTLEPVAPSQQIPPARQPGGSLFLIRAAAAAVLLAGVASTVAIAWPSEPAGLDDAELAALRDRIHGLETALAVRPLTTATEGSVAAADLPPLVFPRVSPWETAVTPFEDTGSGEAAWTGTRDRGVEIWEEHGGRRVLQDAYDQLDDFHRDRRELALREDFRRLTAARAAEADDRPTTDRATDTVLSGFLGSLRVEDGDFATYEQIQVWPIVNDDPVTAKSVAMTATRALRANVLRVREGSTDDSIWVENSDARGRTVLLLAGDVFQGGHRDRVAAQDVLLAPGERRSVRVVDTGGEHRRGSTRFGRSDGIAPVSIRAMIAGSADQTAIDERVTDALAWLGGASGNGSLDEIFTNDQLLRRADGIARALGPRLDADNVVGFAVAAGQELLGVEVFGDHATFEAARTRALRSYVIEAMSRADVVGDTPGREVVEAALLASRRAASAVGDDDVTTFLDPESGAVGHGLVAEGRVVHAVIFSGSGPVAAGARPGRLGDRLGSGPSVPGAPDERPGDSGGPERGDGGTGGAGVRPGR